MIIENDEYLVYYISSKKKHVYIKQLLFDIKKALNYNKIIIFVENFQSILSAVWKSERSVPGFLQF